jgi:hypothetical protein
LAKSDTSAPPVLALELAKHVLRAHELVAEDASGDAEEIADQGVAQGVPDRGPFLPRRHHVIHAQHPEVLGHARLIDRQDGLELLHRPLALDQELHEPNSDGVRQGLEEPRFERLELADRGWACHADYCIGIL